jgi:general stress protein YciG
MANNQNDNSGRGFAGMDDEQQREIASKGGQSQGKENNPGNFANDTEKASRAGQKGGQASGGNTENLNNQ